MAIDWDDDFGNDPFGNGQSADVFGSNLDDVDVWKGHDSFDGDQEWIEFNDDDPEEELEGGDTTDGVSKLGSGKSSSSSGKRRSKKPGGGSSSRSAKSSSSSRKTSSSRSGSSSSNSKGRKSSSRHGSHRESSRRLGSGDNKYLEEEDDPFLVDSSSAHGQHEHRGASPAPSSRSPTRQSSRGSRPKSSRSGYTDDAIASSYRTTNSSRSGSRRTPNLVRRSDGTVSQRRPRDQMAHNANSRDRRASVRDSLFKSLGDEDDDGFPLPPKSMKGPSLSGFLDHNSDKKSDKGRSDGSVRSAPATSEEHRRRSQQGKSRRWHNKMLLPPSGRESSSKKGGDDAAAGEAGLNIQNQGYIEVVDGKMRLVFDVES